HGGIVANAAIVPAGDNGAISVFATGRTDLIIDVTGYFTADPLPQSNAFYTTAPCRLVDTRNPAGPLGAPSLSAGLFRSFPLLSGPCQIPAWATAYSLNATVVPTASLGFLTLWPSNGLQPVVSTLNSLDGAVVANAALLTAGAGGAINAFATDKTELILDVNGYFGTSGNPGELHFRPLPPCRVADTRVDFAASPIRAGDTRDFAFANVCGVPVGAKAYSVNVTAVPSGPLGYLTMWPSGSGRPFVSTLNSFLGRVVANAALVPAGINGAVSIFVTNETHVVIDVNGYFQ
ncbi:MAG: hypothetical protein JNK48_12980, partial [Bryobacterales bacterium]|nr:hypothetical protein [Bryobacterales bacterium]